MWSFKTRSICKMFSISHHYWIRVTEVKQKCPDFYLLLHIEAAITICRDIEPVSNFMQNNKKIHWELFDYFPKKYFTNILAPSIEISFSSIWRALSLFVLHKCLTSCEIIFNALLINRSSGAHLWYLDGRGYHSKNKIFSVNRAFSRNLQRQSVYFMA